MNENFYPSNINQPGGMGYMPIPPNNLNIGGVGYMGGMQYPNPYVQQQQQFVPAQTMGYNGGPMQYPTPPQPQQIMPPQPMGYTGGIMQNYYNPYMQQQQQGYADPRTINQQQQMSYGFRDQMINTPYVAPPAPMGGYYSNNYNYYGQAYAQQQYMIQQQERAKQIRTEMKLREIIGVSMLKVENTPQENIDLYVKRIYTPPQQQQFISNKNIPKPKVTLVNPDTGETVYDPEKSTTFGIQSYTDSPEAMIYRAYHADMYGIKREGPINIYYNKHFRPYPEKFKDMGLVDFLANAGELVAEVMMEKEKERQVRQLKKNYSAVDYKREVRMGSNNGRYSTPLEMRLSDIPDSLQSSFRINDKNDLEIVLPPELRTTQYAQRKKQFIEAILSDAKRCGTDISSLRGIPLG